MSQLTMPAVPPHCCVAFPRCDLAVAFVLFPGPTGHCERHHPDAYKAQAIWAQSFATGSARIVSVK